jgi:hypothetical protein
MARTAIKSRTATKGRTAAKARKTVKTRSLPITVTETPIPLIEETLLLREGRFKREVFFRQAIILVPIPLLAFVGFQTLGTGLVAICALLQSYRLAFLDGQPTAIRKAIWTQRIMLGAFLAGVLIFEWSLRDEDDEFVTWQQIFLVIVSLVAASTIAFAFTGTAIIKFANRTVRTLPRVKVSIAYIHGAREDISKGLHRLSRLKVFDKSNAKLLALWGDGRLDEVQRWLTVEGRLTTESWHEGLAIFNKAIGYIDTARGKLLFILKECETALTPFNFDYATIDASSSRVTEGYMPAVAAPKRTFAQRVNTGDVLARAYSQVLLGKASWQAAAAVTATMVVVHFINRSKMRRQLREMQWKLFRTATTIKEDFRLMRNLLTTRVIPQYDGLVLVIDRLDKEFSDFQEQGVAPDQPGARDRAFRLACALIDAKRYLEMEGGN